ncbi:hypothetical protein GCM10009639_57280 [Kitasatospora putterlickiae]|uniref:Uncharacterized protein n=1 Tax=Kitasatospora putterlickiae TaxID=221725 RepID=A0ABP4J2L0_9ACTN
MTTAAPDQEAPNQPTAQQPGPEQKPAEPEAEAPEPQEAPPEQPQSAWEAARELLEHVPETFASQGYFFTGGSPRFGGDLIGGDQHTVSGGQVHGDVVTGHKTTIYQIDYGIGSAFGTPLHSSGEIPDAELASLSAVFQDGPAFAQALDLLREQRVLILAGRADSGRRSAALMLLHRLGARRIRNLDPDVSPAALLTGVEQAEGYLLADYTTSRARPLRRPDLDRLRETLARQGGHLVITAGRSTTFRDLPTVDWEPPSPRAVLAAHLRRLLTDRPTGRIEELLTLEPVEEFLAKARPVRELAEFAVPLSECSPAAAEQPALSEFGRGVVQEQVGRWFGDPELPLREKAFLLSLAVFDHAPYALTAELADQLFRRLEAIAAPGRKEGIPPFGNSIEERLTLARAELTEESEQTPWGPVPQRMASFVDPRTPHTLLRETWTGHPSARPAIIAWLNTLATDSRALVRTRVASTAALLASVDLSSAMSRLLGPWSESKDFRLCLQAANSLVLAYYAGTAAVPRILREWADDDNARRRWSAIRGYGLLGPLLPGQAMDAIAVAADRLTQDELDELAEEFRLGEQARPEEQHPDGYQARGLVEAVELLLLSAEGAQVLATLMRWLSGPPQLRRLALATFLSAARRTEDTSTATDRPLLLGWYTESPRPAQGDVVAVTVVAAPEDPPSVRILLTTLWRAALADRSYGSAALDVLRGWLLGAVDQPATETELADLLTEITVTERERQRLHHLLRTIRDGGALTDAVPVADVGSDSTAVDRLLLKLGPH